MYQKQTLKNKVRLITAPLKETATATLLVMVRAGSRYENLKNNGVSHFVEHLMFKGTKKRPNTLALSKELDGVGAEYNAFTGKDYTGYYVKCDTRHLSLAIDVLSDMLLHSLFNPQEIQKERGVIIEEINMYEDNPLMYAEDFFEQLMFSANPLGYSIAGSRETVKNLSPLAITSYLKKLYTGKNIVIGLAGNFTPQHLSEIKNKFNFQLGNKKNTFRPIKIKQSKPRLKLLFKDTEQAQLVLGFPALSYFSKKIYALQLLAVILGGYMSSRLSLEVREKNGLAYFVRSWLNFYEDTGSFLVQSGLDKNRIEAATKLILSQLAKIKKGVTVEELRRAKENLAGRLAIDLENSSNLSHWHVIQEVLT